MGIGNRFHFQKQRRWALLVGLAGLLSLSFNNCSKGNSAASGDGTSISQAMDCSGIPPANLRSPKTIDQVMKLVSVLPQPTTIDCFLSSLQRPLQVYAVNNPFSAQPSAGVNSPRIFIIYGNMTLSVVPAGEGARFLEMSQLVSQTSSVKGELAFPITQPLTPDTPYTRLLDGSAGTNCRFCHQAESRNFDISTGTAYNSNILRPDHAKRVTQSYLLNQAQQCDASSTDFRCLMLRRIYIDGQAQDIADFPLGP